MNTESMEKSLNASRTTPAAQTGRFPLIDWRTRGQRAARGGPEGGRAGMVGAQRRRRRNEGVNPLLKISFHSDSPWRMNTTVVSCCTCVLGVGGRRGRKA